MVEGFEGQCCLFIWVFCCCWVWVWSFFSKCGNLRLEEVIRNKSEWQGCRTNINVEWLWAESSDQWHNLRQLLSNSLGCFQFISFTAWILLWCLSSRLVVQELCTRHFSAYWAQVEYGCDSGNGQHTNTDWNLGFAKVLHSFLCWQEGRSRCSRWKSFKGEMSPAGKQLRKTHHAILLNGWVVYKKIPAMRGFSKWSTREWTEQKAHNNLLFLGQHLPTHGKGLKRKNHTQK